MSGFMGIGGGFNPLQMVSQIAMAAATGGTSIIAQMALKIATEVASQVIQHVGQELGLPQPMIDAAQGALRAGTGDFAGAAAEYGQAAGGLNAMVESFGEQFNASPAEVGDAQRSLNEQVGAMVAEATEGEDFKAAKSSGGKTGGGWLMALAAALGEKLDVMADDIKGLADAITKEDPSTTAKFGAATQEFGILMNATNNALKTLGEAMTTTARKG